MSSKSKPNIVLIVMDQECRWEDLPKSESFHFEKELPARSQLRRDGTSFPRMCAATNPCTPSRSVLYTGQHWNRQGCYANFLDLETIGEGAEERSEHATLGHLLREEGYYTAYKGKWHLSGGGNNAVRFNDPTLGALDSDRPDDGRIDRSLQTQVRDVG